ncbi:M48 family metallopeptidase [Nostoc sp. LPT]|uniref:M48 metallopeptidase family protein n=1 Tax=Nostoc sp. LPT TaxID=2815387 RepID=UPI001DDDF00C|nr:M48 family metallopeptidase [Nostoc sp. LPT]MBN4002674.1 M48 family metallopeptidase [Nostoc sp. LPT]
MIASCDNPKSKIQNPKWKDAQALKDAVGEWSDRIKVQVKQIQLRPMKRKWASISTTGRLTLNTELLDLPKELGEFVIVHELVHLLVPNHGKLFKCFMFAYLPDWEELEIKLQKNCQQ